MRPILVVLACAVLVGCGRDDAADAYRERVIALCEEAAGAAENIPPPRTQDEIGEYLDRFVREFEKYDEEFAAIDPPEELETLHLRAVRESERAERVFRRVVDRIERASNPVAALRRELLGLRPLLRRSERLNREMGVEECNEVAPLGDESAPS